jgi:hypothetical protein
MAEQLLTVRLDRHVEFSLSTLGDEDRRIMEGWFEYLKRWHTDDFIRSRSRKLKPDEELYAFQTDSSHLIFAFSIKGDEATVHAILTKEAVEQFRKAAGAAP